MPKRALSVTLGEGNLLWLRGQAAASGRRSLSETLDDLITDARRAGRVRDVSIRSVVGTIDIDGADPALAHADDAIGAMFEASLSRPLVVRERRPRAARRPGRGKARGG